MWIPKYSAPIGGIGGNGGMDAAIAGDCGIVFRAQAALFLRCTSGILALSILAAASYKMVQQGYVRLLCFPRKQLLSRVAPQLSLLNTYPQKQQAMEMPANSICAALSISPDCIGTQSCAECVLKSDCHEDIKMERSALQLPHDAISIDCISTGIRDFHCLPSYV